MSKTSIQKNEGDKVLLLVPVDGRRIWFLLKQLKNENDTYLAETDPNYIKSCEDGRIFYDSSDFH